MADYAALQRGGVFEFSVGEESRLDYCSSPVVKGNERALFWRGKDIGPEDLHKI